MHVVIHHHGIPDVRKPRTKEYRPSRDSPSGIPNIVHVARSPSGIANIVHFAIHHQENQNETAALSAATRCYYILISLGGIQIDRCCDRLLQSMRFQLCIRLLQSAVGTIWYPAKSRDPLVSSIVAGTFTTQETSHLRTIYRFPDPERHRCRTRKVTCHEFSPSTTPNV